MDFLDTLTLDEVDYIEEFSQSSITSFYEETQPKAKFLTAIFYIIKKRENPSYTIADAKKVSVTEALALVESLAPNPKA
jgi:hypothetical protein